jgi:hypothetical protein
MVRLAFIVASNNRQSLRDNLLQSGIFKDNLYPLIIQEGFINISKAYNQAMLKTEADILIFLHQDVFLPDKWVPDLLRHLDMLESENWGVIGVAGAGLRNNQHLFLGHLLDRGNDLGSSDNLPARVDTLDELLLVIKNNKLLFFDEKIPGPHFYGADICLQANNRRMTCWAIDAFCHHNSIHGQDLPPDFYISLEYMRLKWRNCLPFVTTCVKAEKLTSRESFVILLKRSLFRK